MNVDNSMIQGNLAFKTNDCGKQDSRSFSVLDGGKPSVQGHTNPGFGAIAFVCISIAMSVAIVMGISALNHASVAEASNAAQFQTVKVAEGESLWTLAEDHPVKGLSTQETSDLIRSKNHLKRTSLSAGASLKVPAQD